MKCISHSISKWTMAIFFSFSFVSFFKTLRFLSPHSALYLLTNTSFSFGHYHSLLVFPKVTKSLISFTANKYYTKKIHPFHSILITLNIELFFLTLLDQKLYNENQNYN